MPQQCSMCATTLLPEWFFCPVCGKVLKEKPISVPRQIMIYLVSFFLAPLGLGWGLRYIRSSDSKIKTVGIISIALTVLSIILMFVVFKSVADSYSKMLNDLVPGGNPLMPQ